MHDRPSGGRRELGLVGLGVMGRNLLLNVADHGVPVAGHDRDPAKVEALARARGADHDVAATADLAALVRDLRPPRAVVMLVPAGDPVDRLLQDLLPLLEAGDVVIDGGNSHFRDTERRLDRLVRHEIHYLGLGISGGADGARHGPSLMAGGAREAWARVAPLLEPAAAHVDGEACAAYLGAGGAGHHVKMVHNGIEYGLMQLIAEAYDVLRRVLGLEADAIAEVFDDWREGRLAGFLMDITATILAVRDPDTGRPLVDVIADTAQQKGTGRWASEEALRLQVPTPTIDAGVVARNLSSLSAERHAVGAVFPQTQPHPVDEPAEFTVRLGAALHAAMVLTYAQGFALLHRASAVHGFGHDLPAVARVWRGGCIIRAALLDDLHEALAADPVRPNLLLHVPLAEQVARRTRDLAEVLATAIRSGVSVPAFAASHAYLAGLRSARLPAALVQAQRDYFGHHGYERRDREGTHHTDWAAAAEEASG